MVFCFLNHQFSSFFLQCLLLLPLQFVITYLAGAESAHFTITNKCSYPVWPAAYSNPSNHSTQLPTTGFVLQPGESKEIPVPASWSGRIWGRTLCNQNPNTGKFSCLTGDCASSTLQCSGRTAVPPTTLAQFSLGANNILDFYDISLVDGFNLPMLVSPHGGAGKNCSAIGCVVNLNPACPSELSVVDSDDGQTVACKSACLAFGGKSEYCCTVSTNCTPTAYSQFFKVACPQAYSYAYDGATSTFTCAGADYNITFCPNSNTSLKGVPAEGSDCSTASSGWCSGAKPGSKLKGWKLGLVVSLPAIGVLLIAIYCFMSKLSSSSFLLWKNAKNQESIELILKSHGSLGPKRYSYSEVKRMTNSFSKKLGQGGYGAVFEGKLPDGRQVAVKLPKKSKSNGEDFVNEVASISRTSHVNIVNLLGFCFNGSKRALIYEFMPKGSLEKYIYRENSQTGDDRLGWEKLEKIAVGIAQGLAYLHRGCSTRILHFDIKPHNILLDENFCPKIADFGLAKICLQQESIISMHIGRGTPGYVAPEVFFGNFGGVSHKCDVYSYGMLVLEMVGGRKNLCVEVENTSELYFPHWIHKRLVLGEELGVRPTENEEEKRMARKMIIVSLWCIQTNPSDRPPMSRVIEMLQGSLESLQIPPCPSLSFPSRSPDPPTMESSKTHTSLS